MAYQMSPSPSRSLWHQANIAQRFACVVFARIAEIRLAPPALDAEIGRGQRETVGVERN